MNINEIKEVVKRVFREDYWTDVVAEPNLVGTSYQTIEGGALEATIRLVKVAQGFILKGTCFSQGQDVLAPVSEHIYDIYAEYTEDMVEDRASAFFNKVYAILAKTPEVRGYAGLSPATA